MRKFIINGQIGELIKTNGNYGLLKFENGSQFVYNLLSLTKNEIL